MKKLILTIAIVLSTLISFGQSVYRVSTAELYLYNSVSEEWILDTKLSDLKIDITVEEEFLSIHAKSPSMYRIYTSTKEIVTTKSLKGHRYSAIDLKTNNDVKIDILKHLDSNVGIISIVDPNRKFNFRYFITIE
jgi:hypothetical protein